MGHLSTTKSCHTLSSHNNICDTIIVWHLFVACNPVLVSVYFILVCFSVDPHSRPFLSINLVKINEWTCIFYPHDANKSPNFTFSCRNLWVQVFWLKMKGNHTLWSKEQGPVQAHAIHSNHYTNAPHFLWYFSQMLYLERHGLCEKNIGTWRSKSWKKIMWTHEGPWWGHPPLLPAGKDATKK